ncbi:SIMPL domain-containing protein [Afifella pfennigii]|uniref:SIMPL domain-containing protein n=1 Tax=Afifella pfennigii TaxID=209897 RepID=UPI00047CAC06|nr:SIMPL domain-containing protein [Afifella pfennigii]
MPAARHLAPYALALAALFAAPALAQEAQKPRPSISVTGTGEASGAPDMAVVRIGVVEEAESAEAALQANSEAMAKVTEALKAAGIAERDLQTSGFSIRPVYANERPQPNAQPSAPEITGYRVENLLTVRIRELQSAGARLDEVVKLGSNRIEGLTFTLDDARPLQAEARKNAVEDASARAKELAEAAGVALGPILSISEQSFGRPQPQMMSMARAEAAGGAVPMEAGEVSVNVQVNMVWEIGE